MLFMKLSEAPVGMAEAPALNENLSLYPNPTNGRLVIAADAFIRQVYLYNSVGTLVQSSQDALLDLSKLASGVYTVAVELEHGIEFSRVVRQ